MSLGKVETGLGVDLGAGVECQGRVRWFNESKGFGFIEQADGKDVFVHYTSILGDGFKSLPEGASVLFELVETERGPQASRVRVLGNA